MGKFKMRKPPVYPTTTSETVSYELSGSSSFKEIVDGLIRSTSYEHYNGTRLTKQIIIENIEGLKFGISDYDPYSAYGSYSAPTMTCTITFRESSEAFNTRVEKYNQDMMSYNDWEIKNQDKIKEALVESQIAKQKAQLRKQAAAKKAAELKRLKKAAVKKLTPEERKALGV